MKKLLKGFLIVIGVLVVIGALLPGGDTDEPQDVAEVEAVVEDVEEIEEIEEVAEVEPITVEETTGVTKEEQAYIDTVVNHTMNVSKTMTGISEGIDNNNIDLVLSHADTLVMLSDQYLNDVDDVPEVFGDVHSNYTFAMKDYKMAGQLLIQGINEDSAEKVNRASEFLITGMEYVNQATIEVENAKGNL